VQVLEKLKFLCFHGPFLLCIIRCCWKLLSICHLPNTQHLKPTSCKCQTLLYQWTRSLPPRSTHSSTWHIQWHVTRTWVVIIQSYNERVTIIISYYALLLSLSQKKKKKNTKQNKTQPPRNVLWYPMWWTFVPSLMDFWFSRIYIYIALSVCGQIWEKKK
jgi:hypothetical protein